MTDASRWVGISLRVPTVHEVRHWKERNSMTSSILIIAMKIFVFK